LHCESTLHVVNRSFGLQDLATARIIDIVESMRPLEAVTHAFRAWNHIIFVLGLITAIVVIKLGPPSDMYGLVLKLT
jgi:hypothetical protein